MAEEQTAEVQPHTGLEIVSRISKVILFIATLFSWGLSLVGAYSVYLLWNVDPSGDFLKSHLRDALTMGWVAISAIVLIRLVQIILGWAILAPIEARLLRVDLRDPEIAEDLRTRSRIGLTLEAIALTVYIAVPLLIAHFRFGYAF
jgi:hypothetical protein